MLYTKTNVFTRMIFHVHACTFIKSYPNKLNNSNYCLFVILACISLMKITVGYHGFVIPLRQLFWNLCLLTILHWFQQELVIRCKPIRKQFIKTHVLCTWEWIMNKKAIGYESLYSYTDFLTTAVTFHQWVQVKTRLRQVQPTFHPPSSNWIEIKHRLILSTKHLLVS